jgi:hypothetical protein
MQGTGLLAIARDWSHWDAPPPASVPRIVERDVRERIAARSSAPLRHLAQMLFESGGA